MRGHVPRVWPHLRAIINSKSRPARLAATAGETGMKSPRLTGAPRNINVQKSPSRDAIMSVREQEPVKRGGTRRLLSRLIRVSVARLLEESINFRVWIAELASSV
jgi:hypothetical protein